MKWEYKLTFAVEKLCQIHRHFLQKIANNYGVSAFQLQILQYIYNKNEVKCSIGEIAKEFEFQKATVSTSVAKLVEKGYIERNVSKSDGRLFNLKLTNTSKELIQKMIDARIQRVNSILSSFTDTELETSVMTLLKVIDNYFKEGYIQKSHFCTSCSNFTDIPEEHKYKCNIYDEIFSYEDIKFYCPEYETDE